MGFSPDMKVTFYPGRWAPDKRSILPVGDITQYVPDSEADVAVLEEPEHLTWYHHGVRWTDKFRHVVGVVHTNYLEYARREENGEMKEKILRFINNWVVRSYCHKVVKLSDAVQDLPRSQTCFIHGVSPKFLQIGEQKAKRLVRAGPRGPPLLRYIDASTPVMPSSLDSASPPPRPAPRPQEAAAAKQAAKQQQQASSSSSSSPAPAPASGSSHHPHAHSAAFSKGVYFIGKVVWGKGYTELLDLVEKHRAAGGSELEVDVYGGGDDLGEVQRSAKDRRLPLHFHGPKDHADGALQGYKVFVNPSLSDVVATTTAEALAMGKWVVVAEHPSNAFFTGRFRNCLTYRTPEEFSRHIAHAVATDPAPLNEEEKHALTWEAATERFMEVADKVPSRKAGQGPGEASVRPAHAKPAHLPASLALPWARPRRPRPPGSEQESLVVSPPRSAGAVARGARRLGRLPAPQHAHRGGGARPAPLSLCPSFPALCPSRLSACQAPHPAGRRPSSPAAAPGARRRRAQHEARAGGPRDVAPVQVDRRGARPQGVSARPWVCGAAGRRRRRRRQRRRRRSS